MSGINRFGFGGVYVLHSDHEAEIARLRAEAEKNRVDAERYRWLLTVLRHNASRWQAVVDYNQANVSDEEFSKAIDAAMGASA